MWDIIKRIFMPGPDNTPNGAVQPQPPVTNDQQSDDALAFITHPNRKDLARRILNGASDKELIGRGVPEFRIREMRTTLAQRGLRR